MTIETISDTPDAEAIRRDSALPATAIVYHFFPHYRLPVMRELARHWTAAGSRLTFASDKQANRTSLKLIDTDLAAQPVDDGGLNWRFLHNRWFGRRLLWQHGLLGMAWSGKHKVLILLGNPYYLTNWLATVVGRLRGKRVLFWTHGVTRREAGLQRWLRYRFLKLADGLLLYGNWARDHLIRDGGFAPERLHVIFNSLNHAEQLEHRAGLTPEILADQRRELFPEHPADPLIVFTGRLTRTKRLDILLHAAQRMREQARPVNVLIVGEGDQGDSLQDLTDGLDLRSRVCFAGGCYDEGRMARLIGAADMCVVPDGVGLVAIHALTYGTPVLMHGNLFRHFPEHEAVLPGINGAIFREGNPRSLARALTTWLEQGRDRENLRRTCHAVVDHWYTTTGQAERIERAVRGEPALVEPITADTRDIPATPGRDDVDLGGPGGTLPAMAAPPHRNMFRTLGRRLRMLFEPARYRFAATGRDFHMGRGCRIQRGAIVVGDYSFVGNECQLACRARLGNWVVLGSRVSIVSGDMDFVIKGVPSLWVPRSIDWEVTIADDVWVGHGATIALGAHIGEGAMIMAGAVVTEDVAPYTVVGGIPAHFRRRRFTPEAEAVHRRALAELRRRYCRPQTPSGATETHAQ